MSRSSVSLWVRDVAFDRAAWEARAEANSVNGDVGPAPSALIAREWRRRPRSPASRRRAGSASAGVTDKEFLVAGTALYAAEGGKTGLEVSFANSDPRMIPPGPRSRGGELGLVDTQRHPG